MTAIFRDDLGTFTVEGINFMVFLSGEWIVDFLDGGTEEYPGAELLEVSL